MDKSIEIFVPGRLCLFGEHSDWASEYRKENNKIEKGYAIVTGIEQGIYGNVQKSKDIEVISETSKIYIKNSKEELNKIAKSDNFYAYVSGTCLYMSENYNVDGIKINIEKSTLPIKKGLSSSTAICVLVVKAYNMLYNLELTQRQEMECAYQGERNTLSKCGRLDQVCAIGKKTACMEFDGYKVVISELKIGKEIPMVFAILNGEKNTIKILKDLSSAYPIAKSKIDKRVQKALGEKNKKTIIKAKNYLEDGNIRKIGKLMNKVQKEFDKSLKPKSQQDLQAPKLHEILKDKKIRRLIYGGKCVGSGGDGTVQFIAKSPQKQEYLYQYIKNKLQLQTYKLTLNKNKE